MQISEEAKNLLDKINSGSSKLITNSFEVEVILDSLFNSGNKKCFNDLIFKAKYVNGLKNVLSNRIVTGDDFMEKIFKEFNVNLQEFSAVLNETVLNFQNPKNQKYFREKYLELKHECVVNTMSLIEDLTLCKEYFNNNSESLSNV